MKIAHLAPLSPYNIGWGYQENLLPKYQRKLGHEVCLVVSARESSANGRVDVEEGSFTLPDGTLVYRRKRLFGNSVLGKFVSFTNVMDILLDFQPDLIMVHSLTTLSVFQAIAYKKKYNPDCVIIQDNHADDNNAQRSMDLVTKACYAYWAFVNRFSAPFVAKFYGVTPWRQEFMVQRFKIDPKKTDVLIMGADMDDINFEKREAYRKELDEAYGTEGKFLIVTGGKIDRDKNLVPLMNAIRDQDAVKLIVFGTVADDYAQEVESNRNDNVIMLGWQNNKRIYELLLAADLAIFPGKHSVLWEQACACKIPCLFSYCHGADHLNHGGNSAFMTDISETGFRKVIAEYCNTEKYRQMKVVARSSATDVYSYYEIAKKSVEMASTTVDNRAQ